MSRVASGFWDEAHRHPRNDRLKTGVAALETQLPGLAAGYHRAEGILFGNLPELVEKVVQGSPVFRGAAWYWSDYENVECHRLRDLNERTAAALAPWPARAQELLSAEAAAEEAAQARLEEEFRLIAEEEVEADLGAALESMRPPMELAPVQQAVVPSREIPLATPRVVEPKSSQEEDYEKAEKDLAGFREEATGDPKRAIPQKSRFGRLVVWLVGLAGFAFAELVFGVSVSTATLAVAFAVALLIVAVFNGLTAIIAEPLNRVLSYWTALWRIRRRGSNALPLRPEGENYVVAFGGLVLLFAAIALMLFLREHIVASTALLAGNTLGLWIMSVAVLVTLLAEISFSPAYPPEVYAGEIERVEEVDRLKKGADRAREERVQRDRDAQQQRDREIAERRKRDEEAERQAIERAAARCYANTPEARRERRDQAIVRRDQTISESHKPFDEERSAIRSMVLERKMLLPPYRAAAEDFEADVLRLCNELVTLINGRDGKSGLKDRIEVMPAVHRRLLDLLREECPLRLDRDSDDLLVPVLAAAADGKLVRMDGSVRGLEGAIAAFENRGRPVRPLRSDFFALYQKLRAQVRDHVLEHHHAIAAGKHGLKTPKAPIINRALPSGTEGARRELPGNHYLNGHAGLPPAPADGETNGHSELPPAPADGETNGHAAGAEN